MNKGQKFVIKIFIFLAILCFATSILSFNAVEKQTPYEWVNYIHKNDSIMITEGEPSYAKTYIAKTLKKKTESYAFIYACYDDSIKAYKIHYHFKPKKSTNTFGKTVWVKIDFKINGGNYIATPKIVKLVSYPNE